nr:phospholipid-transporting ATPase ABCA3-like [Cherax quadricarinatus]
MGLDGWLVWLGWFLHSFIIIIVVASIITLVLKLKLMPLQDGSGFLPPILAYSDPIFIWVLLLLYGISSIAFCFVIATFFSKPTLATTVGVLLWLTSYFIPRTVLDYDYNSIGLTPKIFSCLLPNLAITWAFRVISMFEGRVVGVQWNNVWETGNPRDQLAPAMILLMLVIDTCLFLFITWYVDQVSPGLYGVPRPWYFPFQKTYWHAGTPRLQHHLQHQDVTTRQNEEYFEMEPVGLRPGIIIKNLSDLVKEIVPESLRDAVVAQDPKFIEVAAQWDSLADSSSRPAPPRYRLKGMRRQAAREEAEALMQRLELLEKKNMFGNELSGGMKRKLCLAIALIGGSKVVILDEPSSGLDPESRRWVWDVVQGERGRRTVLVTTHHMEEADVLGDRVAIMASGRVVCEGSTLFLKNKFGDGYTLTVILSEGSKVREVRREVNQHLPSAILRSAQGSEVTFKLPPTTAQYAQLLDALTSRKEQLGIRHLGLSLTSMDQVFLRVGEGIDGSEELTDVRDSRNRHLHGNLNDTLGASLSGSLNGFTNGYLKDREDIYSSQRYLYDSQTNIDETLTGSLLLRQRIKALLVKRVIYSKRKWVLFLTQGLLPVLVTVLCLLVDASFTQDTFKEPPLTLNISIYPYTMSYVHVDQANQHLAAPYESLFWDPYEVKTTDDMEQSLLHEAEENIFRYRENNVCSAEFLTENEVTGLRMLYQSIPYHTPGVSTSLVTNALLRAATNSTEHSITTSNRPLPPNRTWQIKDDNTSASALVYSMVMPLALALLSASFIVFPLQERETKAKQVQVMTGTPVWLLWTTTFLWDYITYLVSAIIVFIIFMIWDSKKYFTLGEAPGALFLLLLLYGWGSIPLAYLFSLPFQTSASGFAVLALVNIIAVLQHYCLPYGSLLYPTYSASTGFMHLVNTSAYNSQCELFNKTIKTELCNTLNEYLPYNAFMKCCPMCAEVGHKKCFEEKSYFMLDKYAMAPDLLTLFINGVVFFAILVVIEAGYTSIFSKMWWRVRGRVEAQVNAGDEVDKDEDVAAEVALVNTMLQRRNVQATDVPDDATLLVCGLSKQFMSSTHPAVNNISFRVGRGECLGLLGVNGAGKTTTFRMLTGDEKPSGGDAMIDNISLLGRTSTFVQKIGYCPQFDAILGELTGLEMLTLVGRLRGVSEGRMKHTVRSLVSLVGLTECAERPSSTYSGGNRRKLSTAMALVGSPPLVFLDEPTSGVDPASRRRVWAAIRKAIDNGQSVVLTSHSMEECEALCSRIIIMSRGTLRCVGSTTHLKAKFGQGYSLHVKLRTYAQDKDWQKADEAVYDAKVADLKNIIRYYLPGASLTDQHKGMMAFRVPSTITWGRLFTVMEALKAGADRSSMSDPIATSAASYSLLESLKARGNNGSSPDAAASHSLVEDYAASDTSLEQVFLAFAREAALTPAHNFKIPTGIITKL